MPIRKKDKITIFSREYAGESIADIENDVGDAISEDYNGRMKEIPQDEHGLNTGVFTVTIVWEEE